MKEYFQNSKTIIYKSSPIVTSISKVIYFICIFLGELCRNAHSLARLCLNAMGLQPSEDAFFHNYQLDSKELLQWNCYLDGYTSVDKAMLRLQQHLKLILKFVKNGQRKVSLFRCSNA